jgi:hypothetical protein
MGKHIVAHGFVKNYTRWICHGEAHCAREEVLRQRIETFDAEAECRDMIEDFHQGNFDEGPDQVMDEAPEATTKAYYDMLSSTQKPLHEHTDVYQLDGIGRLMALKCKFCISRDGFNEMLVVIGTLLPKEHSLPQSSFEAQKLLRVLKMPYEAINACTNGCVLFRKDHVDAKYCPKCKSSRYLELDSSGGHKRQLDVPVKILRCLPFILRIQRLYLTEETAEQMIWHKTGK